MNAGLDKHEGGGDHPHMEENVRLLINQKTTSAIMCTMAKLTCKDKKDLVLHPLHQ